MKGEGICDYASWLKDGHLSDRCSPRLAGNIISVVKGVLLVVCQLCTRWLNAACKSRHLQVPQWSDRWLAPPPYSGVEPHSRTARPVSSPRLFPLPSHFSLLLEITRCWPKKWLLFWGTGIEQWSKRWKELEKRLASRLASSLQTWPPSALNTSCQYSTFNTFYQ